MILFSFSVTIGKNKIKFINGASFVGLHNLEVFVLEFNVCIEQFPNSDLDIDETAEYVTEKCGFTDERKTKQVEASQASNETVIQNQETLKETETILLELRSKFEVLKNETDAEREKCQQEMIENAQKN